MPEVSPKSSPAPVFPSIVIQLYLETSIVVFVFLEVTLFSWLNQKKGLQWDYRQCYSPQTFNQGFDGLRQDERKACGV